MSELDTTQQQPAMAPTPEPVSAMPPTAPARKPWYRTTGAVIGGSVAAAVLIFGAGGIVGGALGYAVGSHSGPRDGAGFSAEAGRTDIGGDRGRSAPGSDGAQGFGRGDRDGRGLPGGDSGAQQAPGFGDGATPQGPGQEGDADESFGGDAPSMPQAPGGAGASGPDANGNAPSMPDPGASG